ncbi:MAG: hypothetical protein HYU57_00180, partial [Micavibrio aeruginosavorus]|nr:hypothetical protein [Micavibrio aeruginosavorus]
SAPAPAAASTPAPPTSEAAAPQRYRVVGSRERELSAPDRGTFNRSARQRPEPGPIQQANMGVRDVTRTINQTVGTVNGFLNSIARARRSF